MELADVTESTVIEGVYLVTPRVFGDDRGYFVETYRREWIPSGREMIQANRGDRIANCIVGLHYHLHQADYWYVPRGHARVVLHDLRSGGSSDGATLMLDMGEVDGGPNNHLGVYIPPGVAHGFASLTDMTITYLVDGYYNPADELGVAWDDPAIAADWGVSDPILSARDSQNPNRAEIDPAWRPHAGLRVTTGAGS
ncbi:MAG: dTDP-4-dehydrorhamnose 3,5-epimerase family protein [Microthrixaceae bacterium]|nr:dTDP-4-dehydrorhamnose 3,5-epimerase family protein [Microthrixaceae bacterium]